MIAAFGPFLPRVSTLGRSPDSMLLMPLLRMSRSRFSITFDFIEDAALAIPPACRRKLPRCLRVPTRAESDLFKKPSTSVSRWPDGNAA